MLLPGQLVFITFIQNESPWSFTNVYLYFLLSDRHFKIRVGNIYPDPYSQEAGVPQGSILSVTLFSLKINSIVSCLLHDIKCSLYVDDLAIITVLVICHLSRESYNTYVAGVMRMV